MKESKFAIIINEIRQGIPKLLLVLTLFVIADLIGVNNKWIRHTLVFTVYLMILKATKH